MISQKIYGPIKLPGRALNNDRQMICSYIIITLSNSAWFELVSLKDDYSWRIEM